MTDTIDSGTPVAWTATPYHAPVLDKEGARIGTAESLLGDEAEDIFHGLAIETVKGHDIKEIPAVRITRITTTAVSTDLSPEEVAALEPYQEQRWLRIGWGGLFRKHPMWEDERGNHHTLGG